MNNPLLNEEQYTPTNTNAGFDPVDVLDLVPGIEAENKRQNAAMDVRISSLRRNDERRVENAKLPTGLQELAKFSETLTNSLVEIQDKKNKADLQRGMMRAFSDGLTPEEEAEFDAAEEEHRQVAVETEKAAQEVEDETGDSFLAERVRGMSDWERYGYLKGQVQLAAQNYGVYLTEAKENASVVIDGRTVTFENAKTEEEYAALQAEVSSVYLERFSSVNPALLNKYLFKEINRVNNVDALNFAEEQKRQRQEDRLIARTDDVITTLSSPEATAEDMSRFILDHPKGGNAGKQELFNIIKEGLANGTIKGEDVLRIFKELETTDPRGTGSLIAKDPGIFGPLEALAEKAISDQIKVELDRTMDDERVTTTNILNALDEGDGVITEEERAAIIKLWQENHPSSPLPDRIKDALTAQETIDKAEAARRLQVIIDDRGYLVEDDFKGMPQSLRTQFSNFTRAVGEEKPNQTQIGEANQAITSALDDYFDVTDGQAPKKPAYRHAERAMRRDYERQYNLALNQGRNAEQAHEFAIAQITKKALTTQTYFQPADTGGDYHTGRVSTYSTLIEKDPTKASTITYLLPDELQEGLEFVKGDGDAPQIAIDVARTIGLPTYDFIRMQLESAGIKVDEERPEVEGEVDGLDPGVQELLRKYPSVGRTTQAVTATEGDTKWFLDSVAAWESGAHGEYDAMNLGGTGIGVNNQAYGSANSCDKNHGCLSSMTVGQVMALQANGDAFAVGRYQFIPGTLKDTVRDMKIPFDTPFDAATQDALAIGRLRWRLINQNSLTGLRTEWQGLWHMPDAEAQELLETARGIISPYNSYENILPALRG